MKRAWLIRVLLPSLALGANLLVAQTTLTWGGGTAPSGPPAGGAGIWNASNLNWTANNGATYQAWTAAGTDPAVFGGTGGLVTISGPVSASSLTFGSSGYTIGGGSLTLVNNLFGFSPHLEVTNSGQTATLNSALTGAVAFYVNGRGTLVLGGANTFNGGINLDSATLKLMTSTGALAIQNVVFGSLPSGTGGGGMLVLDNTGATGANAVQLGAAIALAGEGTVQLNRVAAQTLSLAFVNGYSRTAGAATNFVTSGGTNGTDVKVALTGVATGFVDQGTFFNGSSYAYNDSGGFVRGINYGVDSGTVSSAGGTSVSATTHLKLTGAVTNQATATFTTINLAGANNLTIGSANTVTVSGLLKTGGNAATITGGTIRPAASPTTLRDLVIRTDLATDALTIGSVIANPTTGSTTLTKSGAGALTLTGTNTYSGGTFLDAGTLSVATFPTGTGSSPIGTGALKFSGGTLQYTGSSSVTSTRTATFLGGGGTIEITNSGATLTLNSAISGANTGTMEDSLVKTGAGTLALTGSNDNGGLSAIVNAGTLSLAKTSNSSRHATGNLWINSGGAVQLNGSGGDQIFDAGHVVVNSGGVLDFNGKSESFDGLSGAGSVTNTSTSANATMTFGVNSAASVTASTFGGAISDGATKTMAVVKGGTANQILSGTNTYTGGTSVNGGTLQIGAGGTTGSIAGDVFVDTGGTLAFNRSNDLTFAGAISGSGNVTQLGAGNLTLSGNVSTTGAITIANGTLTPGASTTLQNSTVTLGGGGLAFGGLTSATLGGLAGSGTVTNNLADGLTVGNNGANSTFSGTLTGSGALMKIGSGMLTLSGAANYTGTTYLNEGVLAFASAAAVPTASNINMFGGVIGVGAGAPTSYTTGSGGGQLYFAGDGGFAAVGGNRSITLNGGATLAWGSGGFVNDGFTLILSHPNSTATTTLTNNLDLTGGDRGVRVDNGSAAIDATLSGNLTGTGGFVKGGDGTLTLTGNNTYTGATTIQGGLIEFSSLNNFGNSPSITLDGGGLRYATGNTTDLTAGGRTVTFTYFGGSIDTNGNNVTWANGLHTNSGWITKLGAGALTISGTGNSIAGVHVDNGTLNLQNFTGTSALFVGTAAGQTGTLSLTNSTWSGDSDLTVGFATGATGVATLSNSTFTGGVSSLNVGASGPGTLTVQNGSSISTPLGASFGLYSDGTATIDHSSVTTNSWLLVGYGSGVHGSLTIQNGGIVSTTDATNGATVGYYQANGALVVTGTNGGTPSRFVTAGPMDIGGYGYGNVTVSAGGVLTGGVANIGGTGSGSGDVTITGAGSTWNINAGSSTVYALSVGSAIASSLTIADGGAVNFTGTNKDLSIAPVGTLKIGTGGLAGMLGAATVANLGVLAFNHTDNLTFAGNVTGSGALTKAGAGILTLSGTNDYSGSTTVNGGTLRLGSGNSLPSGTALTLASNTAGGSATLDLNGFNASVASLSLGGATGANSASVASITTGSGTLTLNGNLTFTSTGNPGGSTIGGQLALASGSHTFSIADSTNAARDLAISATISGDGSISKSGAGLLALSGANTGFTGGVSLSAGTLELGNDNALGTGTFGLGTATVQGDGTARSLANGLSLSGNPTFAGSSALTFAGNVALGSSTRTFTVSNSTTLGGVLSGSGGLTKAGTGTLTLNGTGGTFTGKTTISSGTLAVASLANSGSNSSLGAPTTNSAIDIGSTTAGATLQYLGAGNSSTNRVVNLAGTTGGATLDASGAGTVTFTGAFNATGAGSKTLTLTGTNPGANAINGVIADNSSTNKTALAKTGAGAWTLGGSNTYTDVTTISAGTLVVAANNALGTAAAGTSVASGATLAFQNSVNYVTAESVTFSGTGATGRNGALDSLSGANTFAGALALTGNAQVGAAAGAQLTLSGTIGESGGARALTFGGSGTLVLNGVNTFSGGAIVNGGTVTVGASGRLAATTSSLTVNGGTLNLTNATAAAFAGFNGTGGTVNLTGGLIDTTAGADSFAGVLAGSGGVTKSGAGSLALTGDNTYTGATVVNGGTLVVTSVRSGGSPSNLGQSTNAAANLVLDGGTFSFTSGAQSTDRLFTVGAGGATLDASGSGALSFTNSGALAASGSGNRTLTLAGTNPGANTLAAGIVNPGTGTTSVVKTGPGAWTLTGASTYTGPTAIDGGTLTFSNVNNLGSGGAISFDGGTLVFASGSNVDISARGVTLNAGGGTLHTNGNDVSFSQPLGGAGGLTKTGAGTLTFAGSSANTYAGPVAINGGTIALADPANLGGSGALRLDGGALRVTGDNKTAARDLALFAGGGTIDVAGNTLTWSGAIHNASGVATTSLTKEGAGTLLLTGTNDYTGPTFVNHGTLQLGSATALSPHTTLQVGPGGIFDPGAYASQVQVGGLDVQPAAGDSFTFSGSIGGTGGVNVSGGGTLVLAPPTNTTNNYTGPTVISNGTVQLGSSGALSPSTSVQLTNQGTLDLNNHDATVGQLAGTGGTVALGSGNLTVDQTGHSTFNGTLTGSGALNVSGTGNLVLGGANTDFTGPITVTGGNLTLSGSTPNSTITITGGTLSGSGSAGAVVLGAGGHLSPGNSPGTFTAGTITLGSSGPSGGLDWEISNFTGAAGNATTGGWDRLVATSLLDITATSADPFRIYITSLNLANTPGQAANFDPTHSYTFNFVDAASINGFALDKFTLDTSAFANPFTGTWSIGLNGTTLDLIYTGGAPLSSVPEPSLYALLAGVGALGWAWRRRRAR